ncbi:hypothetical protein MRX96_027818 [Rhipicephalus microplus]
MKRKCDTPQDSDGRGCEPETRPAASASVSDAEERGTTSVKIHKRMRGCSEGHRGLNPATAGAHQRRGSSTGNSRRRGRNQLRPPTLPAGTEPSSASPAGKPGTSPADAPAAKNEDDDTMNWSQVVPCKKRHAPLSPGPFKERLAVVSRGGPGSSKDDLPVPKRPAATTSD